MQAEQWQQAMDAWSELSRAAWGEPRDRAKVVGDVRRRKEEEEEVRVLYGVQGGPRVLDGLVLMYMGGEPYLCVYVC